jgi:hypothetical protein
MKWWYKSEIALKRLIIVYASQENGETSSVDWAQLSTFLPEDGDRIQSPKRCF